MIEQKSHDFGRSANFQDQDIDLNQFAKICDQETMVSDYPLAASVENNVLIYEGEEIRHFLKDVSKETALEVEFCSALKDGPGVFAIRNAYPDVSIVDRSTTVFREIITDEKLAGVGKGDHFGDNERIWNSFQKASVRDPDLFIDYYSNPLLAIACQAWLGPYYQISAQLNNVRPGNQAQSSHRDYHLGFQTPETVGRFPAHAQIMSQYLTLQGAVAHSDMPIESGPTMLLPFSHQYAAGYLTYTLPDFGSYFEKHQVQLAFQKGDMIFFNPALFHGAGTNTSSTDRIANLLQISSAFGRTMESINNTAMVEAVYPSLLERVVADTLSERQLADTIAAVADGYSFPTNLDSDPPVGGNAPETGQQLLHRALLERWTPEQLNNAMDAYDARREANTSISNNFNKSDIN